MLEAPYQQHELLSDVFFCPVSWTSLNQVEEEVSVKVGAMTNFMFKRIWNQDNFAWTHVLWQTKK